MRALQAISTDPQAFWDMLAQTTDHDAQVELESGLLLVRHFDLVYRSGNTTSAFPPQDLHARVMCVRHRGFRALFTQWIRAMRDGSAWPTIPTSIAEYASLLETRGAWTIAHDVWDSLVRAHRAAASIVPTIYSAHREYLHALIRRAYSNRRLGRLEHSVTDYLEAQYRAEAAGTLDLQLLASIGGSVSLASRSAGYRDCAMTLLDADVGLASQHGWNDIEAKAVMARGHIRSLQRHYDLAMLDFARAWELSPEASGTEQAHALVSIAACAAECGYWELARDTNELIVATSPHELPRSIAICNLIELYIWTNDRSGFLSACARANGMTLDPAKLAYAHLYTIRGRHAFRFDVDVHDALVTLQRTAQASGLASLVAEIADDLERTEAGNAPMPPIPRPAVLPLALRRMHQFLRHRLAHAAA